MSSLLFDLPAVPAIPVRGDTVRLPIGRIFCVGRNYAKHAAEMGTEIDPEKPFYFTKSAYSAVLSGAEAPYPPGTDNYHHEMEMAIAIGAQGFQTDRAEAKSVVFGYCCALDMTRRDLQLAERAKQRPWDLGKDVEGSAVFAQIAPAASFDPSDQRIHLSVNGEIRQDATLEEPTWKVDEIVAHLSGFYHLRPGDLILTGTPTGVGSVQPGDEITGGVDGLDPISFKIL